MSIIGRTYVERGEPVVVITQWAHSAGDPTAAAHILWIQPPARFGPRNVAIRRASGRVAVRPFRGLRKPQPEPIT